MKSFVAQPFALADAGPSEISQSLAAAMLRAVLWAEHPSARSLSAPVTGGLSCTPSAVRQDTVLLCLRSCGACADKLLDKQGKETPLRTSCLSAGVQR